MVSKRITLFLMLNPNLGIVRAVHLNFLFCFCSFIKAKSEVSLEDVNAIVEVGLELFRISENKLYAQVCYLVFPKKICYYCG